VPTFRDKVNLVILIYASSLSLYHIDLYLFYFEHGEALAWKGLDATITARGASTSYNRTRKIGKLQHSS
jgi:hypothetical protein